MFSIEIKLYILKIGMIQTNWYDYVILVTINSISNEIMTIGKGQLNILITTMLNQIYNEDCLEGMKRIPDGSIDAIITDPPYGTTACKWDSIIPLDLMWGQLKRVIKPNGAIVMTASQPFTTTLISSNMQGYCYNWVWNKRFAGNFVQAKRQPLKDHEDVCVFSLDGKMPTYAPIMLDRDKPIKKGKNECELGAVPLRGSCKDIGKMYDKKYPTSVTSLEFSSRDVSRGLHPTQKPVALMEYLIRTYTNE